MVKDGRTFAPWEIVKLWRLGRRQWEFLGRESCFGCTAMPFSNQTGLEII